MGSSSDVPALRRGLAVLRVLAARPGPVSAAVIARELELPRSTTYHLLSELIAAGFVTHLPEERRYGLGVATFELGSAYLRHEPLERLAGPLLRGLVDRVGHNAHLGVLHGSELLYLIKERPAQPQTLVTDVGVRLPAQLAASGRAMLAHLPRVQVRALFPRAESFVLRTERGPRDLPGLRRLLTRERRRGWSVEDGEITEGFASVACAAFDHGGRPAAAISVTVRHHCADLGAGSGDGRQLPEPCGHTWPELARLVRATADELTNRIGGRPGEPDDPA
ncbi:MULTISPECIES: IclR family transcriptional regulator [unclassified Actinopolyspora]|uniref:IclR family transcriptional regulator n=1 Tax=unclassified Actinopolyspora TaxID=2639451 RepID=UPI0013F5A045|nr:MULTISPECIES: IclR family transcriptional regulator [unclassified Actinopolyspora]NHD18623.1 IclR family transcriptional regulator [Actinopolyspora sp. BKK2]NHE78055.1 IclR family transcriptional regulator [Actinopolyspora sp. BKK1]